MAQQLKSLGQVLNPTPEDVWGELRSLCASPLESLESPYGEVIPSDAHRALEVVRLVAKLPEGEHEAALVYARKECQRLEVDGELFDTAYRFNDSNLNPYEGMYPKYFKAARDGYLGQVYSVDYQGHIVAFYYDQGVLYKTESGYGSCSYCCGFQAARENSTAAEVLEAFRLRGMCKVLHDSISEEDAKHLVEMEHEQFVLRYGEYADVESLYEDSSWIFCTDRNELISELEEGESDSEDDDLDLLLDLYDEYEEYD